MKRVAFVGDPNNINPKTELGEGPEVLTFYGQDFPKGQFVMPDSEAAFKKAAANSHFVVEEPKKGHSKPAEGDK